MKMNKANMAIMGGALVLLLGAAGLLYQSINQYRDVSGQLNEASRQLDALYQRNPFPSEQNIEMEIGNLRTLRSELDGLRAELSQDQVEPVHTAPVRFVQSFRNISRQLTEQAAEHRVGIPPEFAFGFEHHRVGELPNPADVPRLMQQLLITEQLVNILYQAGVREITGINRQQFEVREEVEERPERGGLYAAREPTRRAPRQQVVDPPEKMGVLGDEADFASLRFGLSFRLRETDVVEVLNRLARHSMFIVVTRVEMVNRFEWQPARAITPAVDNNGQPVAGPLAIDPLAAPPRSERVATSGAPQLVHVTLEVEVYRFREDETS